MLEPHVRFCTTSDGVTIALATFGEGYPLVFPPGWVSHLELDLLSPGVPEFYEGLVDAGFQLIRFDGRGTGLSDRNVTDVSYGARVRDIEAVVDYLGLQSCVILAWSMAAPPSVVYAAANPSRVSHLAFFGAFAEPFGSARPDLLRALIALMRAEWAVGSKTVVDFVNPDADRDQALATSQYFRNAAAGEVATGILEEGMFTADVREYLPKLTMPVLVMHRREDRAVPFEYGRRLAAMVPGSRLVPLPGHIHPPFLGDSQAIVRALTDFIAPDRPDRRSGPVAGLQTILFTDMEGSTPLTQRLGDASAQDLIRVHNTIVREGLKAHGGAEIKHTGDGIMASFPSASGALDCAIAIQTAFAAYNEEAQARDPGPGTRAPILVRAGLNAGEPVAEESDLFGTAVQLAARVCSHAQPGQIVVSDVVRQLAAGKSFLFADLGEVALRGFEDPVRLYEVRWEP